MSSCKDYQALLQSYKKEQNAPYECPNCNKFFKSYVGIEYHLNNVCNSSKHASTSPRAHLSVTGSSRKSRPRSLKKKKAARARSTSPFDLNPPIHETLTWAESQRLVVVEYEGSQIRLDIDMPIKVVSKSVETFPIEEESQKIVYVSPKPTEDITKKTKTAPRKSTAPPSGNGVPPEKKPLPTASYQILDDEDLLTPPGRPRGDAYFRYIEPTADEIEERVEYDLDEQDMAWLEQINKGRLEDNVSAVHEDQLETLIDQFEKESYFEHSRNSASAGQSLIDEDAVCCVCNDGECQNSNQILFCDLCNLAVHQECYGVPYIPEGQWLCRRCLQSPSCPVDCCLCPNKNGAFKQTDDGRWAHVICALWVPEVGFSNPVFLEPIDSLKRIPAARWKLTCYVCKQRNAGACIQCNRANCYTAFHVTCAQQAGLYMKMEPVNRPGRNGPDVTVKKEAFCDAHTPPDTSPRTNKSAGSGDEKLRKARQLLAEKRHQAPHVSIPLIAKEKMLIINRKLSFPRKGLFLRQLLSYWTLKRQERNGVPLLRRLQSSGPSRKSRDPEVARHQQDQLNYWGRLRHDLERARLLSELIRKREKMKRENVKYEMILWEMQTMPLNHYLRSALTKLRQMDMGRVFHQPVSIKEAPNYYKIILNPMDFRTMEEKIDALEYTSIAAFEKDLKLVVDNCIFYNSPNSHFYSLAMKIKEKGKALIRAVEREYARCGVDDSGLLSKEPPKPPVVASDDQEAVLNQQMSDLHEELDLAIINSRKTKKIRTNLNNLRRRQCALKRNNLSTTSQINDIATTSRTDDDVTTNVKDDSPKKDHRLLGDEDGNHAAETGVEASDEDESEVKKVSSMGRRHRTTRLLSTSQSVHKSDDDDDDDVTSLRKARRRSTTSRSHEQKTSRSNKRVCKLTTEDFHNVSKTDVTSSRDYASSEEREATSTPRLRKARNNQKRSSNEGTMDAMLDGINKQRTNYLSTTEDEDEDDKHLSQMHPLDLVWAKCRGYPAYPAMLIDPRMPKTGMYHNGVPIPVPPDHVLQAGLRQKMVDGDLFLVLFFDTKRTWQWLPRNKLDNLASNLESDQVKLNSIKKPAIRKNVQAAYQRALTHRKCVAGDDLDDDNKNDDSNFAEGS